MQGERAGRPGDEGEGMRGRRCAEIRVRRRFIVAVIVVRVDLEIRGQVTASVVGGQMVKVRVVLSGGALGPRKIETPRSACSALGCGIVLTSFCPAYAFRMCIHTPSQCIGRTAGPQAPR